MDGSWGYSVQFSCSLMSDSLQPHELQYTRLPCPSPTPRVHPNPCWFASSVQFSHSVVSDSLWPHGLQHTRLPCPSPTPRIYSNSCLLSWWCHPTISSSVVSFSSHLQSFPASGSFPMSQFFASGGQSIGVSASASVLPMNIQDWSPLGWTCWSSLHLCSLCREVDSLPLNHQGSPWFFSSAEVIFKV